MVLKSSISTQEYRKKLDKLLREFPTLKNKFVTIGVHEAEGNIKHPGNPVGGKKNRQRSTSVAEVAFFNEYGTINIPQRPFMRSAIDVNMSLLTRLNWQIARDIVDGKIKSKDGLNRLGFVIMNLIKNRITISQTWAKPLEPSTIRAKRGALEGSSKPLVDSGLLKRSITFQIGSGRGDE